MIFQPTQSHVSVEHKAYSIQELIDKFNVCYRPYNCMTKSQVLEKSNKTLSCSYLLSEILILTSHWACVYHCRIKENYPRHHTVNLTEMGKHGGGPLKMLTLFNIGNFLDPTYV